MAMAETNVLNPHPAEFERFLYASVGEDRNGSVVTVLSMLARLGLDPWNETAELVTLGREAACARLGLLLSNFRDVPALGRGHGSLAGELSLLLPEIRPLRSLTWANSTAASGRLTSSGAIWTVLVILIILVQILFTGVLGSGE